MALASIRLERKMTAGGYRGNINYLGKLHKSEKILIVRHQLGLLDVDYRYIRRDDIWAGGGLNVATKL